MVPFWLGLLFLIILLIYCFLADFVALAMELRRLDRRDAIAGVSSCAPAATENAQQRAITTTYDATWRHRYRPSMVATAAQ
jgi:hypothetical protein